MTDVSHDMRVLHVSMPTIAGVPRVLAGYVADQIDRGWRVSVACPPDGWLPDVARDTGAHVLPWPATRAPGPRVAEETARLARLIAREDPNVVHLHSAKAGLAGRLAVRRRRATVFQPHAWSFLAVDGPMREATIRWERFATRWTDALVCVSAAEERAGLECGVRASTWVLPNGVDLSTWTAATAQDRALARIRLGLADRPRAVCIGRLCEQKGQRDLLDAWDEVRRVVPAPELVLVGDGPDRARLEGRVARTSGVVVVGERDDVADWFAAANVVVVPSRWDGMALVALEAMARARSVVATAVAGVAESVPASAGAVVGVGDRLALGGEVAARLLDGKRADSEGIEGRRHVEQCHDQAKAAALPVSVYAEVLQRRQPRRRSDRAVSGPGAPSPARYGA